MSIIATNKEGEDTMKVEDIEKTLSKIKNAWTFAGREVTTADYVRDVNFLLGLVYKAQGMANEINILTAENRRLIAKEALDMKEKGRTP